MNDGGKYTYCGDYKYKILFIFSVNCNVNLIETRKGYVQN